MNFGDGNVDGYGLLAGLDFLLVAAMAKVTLDFDINAFDEFGGRVGQLAPDTIRCHSVRLSYVPASFLQLLLVASEKVVTTVPLEV